MKKLELYVCEVCGTQYNDKTKCKMCEKSHYMRFVITGQRYLPYTVDKTGMPITIDLTDADGKVYRYKR